MQTQKQKGASTKTEEATVEADTTITEAVLEECDNCLADIDAVLTEIENHEPTDEEILAKGHQSWSEYYYANGLDKMDGPSADGRYNEWFAEHEKYKAAYLAVTGMVHEDSCTC